MLTKDECLQFCHKFKEIYHSFDFIEQETPPYIWVNATTISHILKFKNIRSHLTTIPEGDKTQMRVMTSGGQQYVNFITCDAVIRFIVKSRNPHTIDIAKRLKIDIISKYYISIETDIIKSLLTVFDGNIMIPQYRSNQYMIDLYFPEYLLAVEIDELHHNNPQQKLLDAQRQHDITTTLGCRFIRCSPYHKDFNLFGIINEIYIHLSVYPRLAYNGTQLPGIISDEERSLGSEET
jgi:very-short-patch-repair endonuclease